jgi:hypothetical protein
MVNIDGRRPVVSKRRDAVPRDGSTPKGGVDVNHDAIVYQWRIPIGGG